MAAAQYYAASSPDIPLKPMHLAPSSVSVASTYSIGGGGGEGGGAYNPLPPNHTNPMSSSSQVSKFESSDLSLKKWIRILKLISRIIATLLSGATLVPLIMTIAKFLQTKNIYFDVDGQRRNAWAHDSITWYTYMYASVSGISFVLNAVVLAAYARGGVKHANKASEVSSYWTWAILLVHVVVWCVSAGLYRYGKEPVDGKFRDLWGWTCSSGARELQAVLTSVDFQKYCGVQSTSFYIGLTNIGTALLSTVILVLAIMRRNSKKKVQRVMYQPDLEPLRHH